MQDTQAPPTERELAAGAATTFFERYGAKAHDVEVEYAGLNVAWGQLIGDDGRGWDWQYVIPTHSWRFTNLQAISDPYGDASFIGQLRSRIKHADERVVELAKEAATDVAILDYSLSPLPDPDAPKVERRRRGGLMRWLRREAS